MMWRARVWRLVAVAGALGLAGSGLRAEEPRRYDGYAVARVQVADREQLAAVLAASADVWSESVGVGAVDVLLAPGGAAALDGLGVSYRVWIEDVQELIDAERVRAGRDWFDAYHPYEDEVEPDIVGYLEGLAGAQPGVAQVFSIGTTVEDRPIVGLRIAGPGQSPLSPAVVYFGAVHAREWIAATVPQYVAAHLLAGYGNDPQVTDLVDHVEFLLIPVGNPDGYAYTWGPDRLWRKNRRPNGDGTWGVDINRNWGYGWGGEGSSGYTSAGTYRGPEPFSEPETRALRDLFIGHPNIRAQVDIHSYSQLVLWPWGCRPDLPPDQAAYAAAGQTMQQLILAVHGMPYRAGPIYSTIYPVSGGSVDWTYAERDVFSMSFELRDTGTYGFLLPAAQIVPNNQEILPTLLYLAGSDAVRATQIRFPEGRPAQFVAGADTVIRVAITSGVELLDAGSATVHYRYDPAGPFTAAPLLHVAGALFQATLPPTNCLSTPEYYFSITGSAGTTTAPADAPLTTYAATMVSGRVIFADDLSADPGWSADGLWQWGQPAGLGGSHGGPDPKAGHTGPCVYGYNLQGDYTNNMPPRCLTTPAIDCTGRYGLRLSFWRWLGVEQPAYDRAAVEVSRDGTRFVPVWENPSEVADNQWVYQDFDISAVADDQPAVYVRWVMGPTDTAWVYCGWNIDDVQIYATGCVGRPGDHDGDRDIDAADFAALEGCLLGPDNGLGPGCAVFDMTGEGAVDLYDLAAFQRVFGGP